MEEIKWHEFEETYKNNLLILNLFFSFIFSFLPFFLFIFFLSHFPTNFPRIKHNLKLILKD